MKLVDDRNIQLDSLVSSSSTIRAVTLCSKCTHTIECQDCRASNLESLKQVLRTSFDPLSSEATLALKHKAASLQHDADQLSLQIFQLQNTLSELEDARNHLQECANHIMGLPAPIRRLPIDILGEIFSFALASEAAQGYCFTFHEVTGRYTCKLPLQALRLSQVCHLWRCITMSSPKLWSFSKWAIHLDTEPGARTINLISHYLEMSKPLPLSLQLVTYLMPSPEVLRVVLSHSARLRYVLIRVTPYLLKTMGHMLRYKGDRPVGGYFPNLEEADLRDSQRLMPSVDEPMENSVLATDIFAVAPKLRSLVLDRFQSNSTAFPYHQLEELTLGAFNALTDWKALSKLGLKKLLLFRKHATSDLQWPVGARFPVLFPTISFLHISIDTNHRDCSVTLAMLFRGLIFPSLETLHLSSGSDCETGPPAFKLLISQPQSLKELRLDWRVMTHLEFREMFQFLPQLTKLTYHGLPSSLEALVDLLTVHKDTNGPKAALLPALLHLDIGLVGDRILNAVAIMAISRWEQSKVVSLESLVLTYEVSGDGLDIPHEMLAVLCGACFNTRFRFRRRRRWA